MDTALVSFWFAHQLLVIAGAVILLALAYRPILWLCGIILVPNDSIGVVTRKFARPEPAAKLHPGRQHPNAAGLHASPIQGIESFNRSPRGNCIFFRNS
jgi:hypothetical protein